jgi:hypothetical protein
MNSRHTSGVNVSTGPDLSVVSRTSTPRSDWPSSTQLLPLVPLQLDLRQRGSKVSIMFLGNLLNEGQRVCRGQRLGLEMPEARCYQADRR